MPTIEEGLSELRRATARLAVAMKDGERAAREMEKAQEHLETAVRNAARDAERSH